MIEEMRILAEQARDHLQEGDLDSYGQVMIQNNECQRSLHPELIPKKADSVIQIAKEYGAAGWKVNGAGGEGGSLTLLSSPEESLKIKMIEETIEGEIRPSLKHDGGDVELIDVIGNRVLVAKRGTCAVCQASEQTFKNLVESKLQELVWPELVVEEVSQ